VTHFVPDYQRVAEDIRQQIRDGRLAPRDQLPLRRELISHYTAVWNRRTPVSGTTIDSAMLILKSEGWIIGHQGRGTFVADNPPK
jgi:GntR family transcriptional regulator